MLCWIRTGPSEPARFATCECTVMRARVRTHVCYGAGSLAVEARLGSALDSGARRAAHINWGARADCATGSPARVHASVRVRTPAQTWIPPACVPACTCSNTDTRCMRACASAWSAEAACPYSDALSTARHNTRGALALHMQMHAPCACACARTCARAPAPAHARVHACARAHMHTARADMHGHARMEMRARQRMRARVAPCA